MKPHRVQLKLFVASAPLQRPSELTGVFQRWIQRQQLPELLIDVVDYEHVHQGPQVLLVGHESDYAYDLEDDRAGLLYTGKHRRELELTEALRLGVERLARAASLLEQESTLSFSNTELLLRFPDRLLHADKQISSGKTAAEGAVKSAIEGTFASFAKGISVQEAKESSGLATFSLRLSGASPILEWHSY